MTRTLTVLALTFAAGCGSATTPVAAPLPREPHVSRAKPRTPLPAPVKAAQTSTARSVWDRIADCESSPTGWDAHGRPIPGSANWHDIEGPYRGGLHFTASTWRENGGLAFAATADRASREQQVAVAERVLRTQGWFAWPVCSKRVGAR